MGGFASAAGLSTDLYRLAYALVGHYRGGLALSTIGGCAAFGAVCGSSVATCATMTHVALPEMLNRNYQPSLACGALAVGGTLGILIPPSTMLVLYGVLTEQSVIALFAAALVPGLVATALYMLAILVYVRLRPLSGPPGPVLGWAERVHAIRNSWGVIALALIVSGGIYGGVFTVIEAAAVGVIISIAFTIMRGKLTPAVLREVLGQSASATGMIYVIMIGAHVFTYFVTLSHIGDAFVEAVQAMKLEPLAVIAALTAFYLAAGAVFDEVAAMIVTLPFVFPLVTGLGYDPLWFGVYNVMVIGIGLVTPPIGINVFVLHGMKPDISLGTINRGLLPFLISDLMRLVIIVLFPAIALWLPTVLGVRT